MMGYFYATLFYSTIPLAVNVGSIAYYGILSRLPLKVQDIIVGSLLEDTHASKYGKT
jgi:hypothetical protein